MPATRLKLTERDRVGDTHSEELNGERWHAKMLRPRPYNQIQTHIYSVLSANMQMNDTEKKEEMESTAGAKELLISMTRCGTKNNSSGWL